MKKMLSTIVLVVWAGSASANVYDDCTAATAAGDKEAALVAAKTILRFTPAPVGLSNEIFECLKFATGQEHVYDFRASRIVTVEEQAIAAQRAEAFAKKIDAMRTKAAEDAALLKANAQANAEKKAASELAVSQRLVEGCRALFKKDPDTTITNKMCYDVFMAIGLPD